jgi:hypothetical protein
MNAILIKLIFAFLVSVATSSLILKEEKTSLSVYYNKAKDTFDVKNVYDINAEAFGNYYKNLKGGYWNYLDAHMQEEVDAVEDHLLYSRALGFLEGYSTCEEIKTFYGNFHSAVFGTDQPGKQTVAFIKENFEWLKKMSAENAETDNYWYTVKSIIQQVSGVYEGYVAGCGGGTSTTGEVDYSNLDHPTLEHFLLINAWGDLYQITMKFVEPGEAARLMGNRRYSLKDGKPVLVERCSSMIKLLEGKSDIVFGHATWDTFESLGPRILKHYNFPLMRNQYAEHHYDVYFSSSPGILSSVDDFFTVSGYAQLGVMETTNSMFNLKLLDQVVPQSVLSWTRAISSNQLAANGADWATHFSRYHSGTYTNQWMVLDLKLFTPGSNPQTGFLTVLEEVPGLIHVEDKTSVLVDQTYWASYNVPYYPDIAEASGYARICQKDVDYCFNTAPRAYIFRDNHSKVTDISSGDWMLSYNDFQHDAASKNDSCNAIACRGDLEPNVASRGAFGALDTKVTSATRAKRFPGNAPEIAARLGPTSYQQPVFCWSQVIDESDYVHNGQPDCFDFPLITFPPEV